MVSLVIKINGSEELIDRLLKTDILKDFDSWVESYLLNNTPSDVDYEESTTTFHKETSETVYLSDQK